MRPQGPIPLWHNAPMRDDAHLRTLYELRAAVDTRIEEGLVTRSSIGELLNTLLKDVVARLRLRGAFVETYGEDLALHLFSFDIDGEGLRIEDKEAVFARTGEAHREKVHVPASDRQLVAQHLDVAGSWFGRAGFIGSADADVALLASALEDMCEVLDNFLFSIKAAREKHNVMMRLGRALRHRVLGEGVKDAVKVLTEAIALDRIVLVYVASEHATTTLHVQVFRNAVVEADTLSADGDSFAAVRAMGRDYLSGMNSALLDHLGIKDAAEEVLINGITKGVVVGKIVVTPKAPPFNTYDRELLSAFAGFVRQRIVDFNKEWRALGLAFRPDDVGRLLQHDDYEAKFLAPREETVGILYVDISGFTRVSETVLRTPAKVAELVEQWSRDAVDIVFRHGGVFDKMVGDCVIALFGPPFYEASKGERLARAIQCAVDIRAMTNALPSRPPFAVLREAGLAVSTGVHLAPLFVGQFGPNANFTGFSSGMNNTARLQGCAARNEILVMEEALTELPPGHPFLFGDARSMPVKNVAEPLHFRALEQVSNLDSR